MARVGLDIDGVLYPFEDNLAQYAVNYGYSSPPWEQLVPVDTWDFYEGWGWTRAEFHQICGEAVDNGELFWHGQPYRGAQKQVQRLQDAGHDIVFITSRKYGRDGSERATRHWLEEVFQIHEFELHCRSDKTAIPVDYFIDDNLDQYASMLGAGVNVMLCDRPWNRHVAVGMRGTLEQYVDYVLRRENNHLHDLDEVPPTSEEVRIVSATGGAKGQKMARLGSLDPEALMKVAEVAGFGEIKYDRLNYMNGYDWSLSYDAGQRHRMAFWGGEDFDPESGLPHLAHAAWHDLAQLAFFLKGLGTDDRYKKNGSDGL